MTIDNYRKDAEGHYENTPVPVLNYIIELEKLLQMHEDIAKKTSDILASLPPITINQVDYFSKPQINLALKKAGKPNPGSEDLLIDGKKPIFYTKMDPKRFGLSEEGAMLQDMAEEYAVVADEKANAGLIVYGKYNGVWRVNPWSTRFLIRVLLEQIGTIA